METSVDVIALETAANRFDDAAGLIERAAATRLIFEGGRAGRAYRTDGAELRRELDVVLRDLHGWSRAAAEIGVGLQRSAGRYRAADQLASGGIG